MSEGRLLRTDRATAFLPESRPVRRLPRAPRRPRPSVFSERFEATALVYDCFWHVDGERILLVGPPPMNLRALYREATYEALPGGVPLEARYYTSHSTMVTELRGAPARAAAVRMSIAGSQFELPIGANVSSALAGRRVLFTMNKDNDLAWIAEWARWHARIHGTDAVLLFDNGSSRYDVGELKETLVSLPGIERIAVVSWPGRFGMTDPAVRLNPYWSHFLQISSMSVALRRFGAQARGLLNCDIDELAATHSGRPIYDLLADARHGLVVFRGQWIEAVGAGASHTAFTQRRADGRRAARQKKWVLDPQRVWVGNLGVHPYWHWVHGRPPFAKSLPKDAFYRHFRAINTNWKEERTRPPDGVVLEPDAALIRDFDRLA